MLYERWERIAAARGGAIALRGPGAAAPMTFAALARAAAEAPAPDSPVVFPQADPAGLAPFLVEILRAWKSGAAVCPLEPGQSPPAFAAGLPRGLALLKTTSATTGAARGAAFTEEQIAADADNIAATMGLRVDWPNVAVISVAHSYGFSNLILPLLLHGIPLIAARSPLPEELRHAATLAPDITLPAVPAMWRAWHEAAVIPPNVRLAISAGAPLPLPLERDIFQQTGVKVHNFYGATECGGIAYDATALPRPDGSCVGTPMANVALSTNEDGCLVVQGRAVGECYWPDAAPSLAPGRYVTSDLAEIRNGFVHLRGRAGDLINVAGRKVSPETVERALQSHPAVRECLVFGAPAPEAERGDRVVACVVARADTTPAALMEHLLAQLPAWQLPRDWHFVETLAPNQRGKLSRAEWRARLGAADTTNA